MADERFVIEFVVDDNGALRILDQFRRKQDEAGISTSKFATVTGLAAGAATALANVLTSLVRSAITGLVQQFGNAISAAQRFEQAMVGLVAVSDAVGVSADAAKQAAQELASDGLITVDDAASALKNLFLTGFGLPEAMELMRGFKDSAALARQGSLSMGEAIVSASEGLKNQNPILVDNVGLTKNLSVIMKELGLSMDDWNRISTDASVRAKVLGGLMNELAVFSGGAERVTGTYSGAVTRLQAQWQLALATIGRAVTENEEVIKAINEAAVAIATFIRNLDVERVKAFIRDAIVELRWALKILGPIIKTVASAFETYLRVTNLGIIQRLDEIATFEKVTEVTSNQSFAVRDLAFQTVPAAEALREFELRQRMAADTTQTATTSTEQSAVAHRVAMQEVQAHADMIDRLRQSEDDLLEPLVKLRVEVENGRRVWKEYTAIIDEELVPVLLAARGGFIDLDGTLNSSVRPTVEGAALDFLSWGEAVGEAVDHGLGRFRDFNAFLTTIGIPGIGNELARNISQWTNWGLSVLDAVSLVKEHFGRIPQFINSIIPAIGAAFSALATAMLGPLGVVLATLGAIIGAVKWLGESPGRPMDPGGSAVPPFLPPGTVPGEFPPGSGLPSDFLPPIPNDVLPNDGGTTGQGVVNVDLRGSVVSSDAAIDDLATRIGESVMGDVNFRRRFSAIS